MDVSPKVLREVEFREKMRGYHPEDVDQFLERVAAGIEVLQDRLRQALERAQRAEAQSSEAGGNDDTIRRTLVLAQRTADLAVQEARDQAARILAGAEQQAQAMIADAEDRARTAHQDSLADGRSQVATLETTREKLQADVENLARWVEKDKAHLLSALHEAVARIEQTELLSPPPVSLVEIPSPPASSGSGSAAEPAAEAPGSEGHDAAAPGLDAAPGDGHPEPGAADDDDAAGPPTVAWQSDEDEPEGSAGQRDPYFAELRRAVNDPGPLGPRSPDDDLHAEVVEPGTVGEEFFDQDVGEGRRLGGRLRRHR